MKIPLLIAFSLTLSTTVSAAPTSEQANLALMLTQLNHIEATLQRAQAQAKTSPTDRFIFNYPQAYTDIQTIRRGIKQHLLPTRAQPRNIQNIKPLSGQYSVETQP